MDHIAVIDIGSNSVRYMEAECTRNGVHSLYKIVHTTRLAHGQDTNGKLAKESMECTANAVVEFKKKADHDGIPVFAYATSALREASNQNDFLSLLNGVVPVEILSGEQEGRLAYYGVSDKCKTMIDIGGGSLQIANESEGASFPIGCVRFADRMSESHPDNLYSYLKQWADAVITDPPTVQLPVAGIGGTITTLAALSIGLTVYDKDAVSRTTLTKEAVDLLLNQLYQMGPDRKAHPLLTKRYSVIIQGGTILKYLMTRFSIPSILCSDRDGMEGYAEIKIKQ